MEDGKLRFIRNLSDMTEFSRTSQSGFAKPESWNVEIPFDNADQPHAQLMTNFTEAILDGKPLIAPGPDGLASVELANAMLYSGLTSQTVTLPLDAEAYALKLQELIAGSRFVKKPWPVTRRISRPHFDGNEGGNSRSSGAEQSWAEQPAGPPASAHTKEALPQGRSTKTHPVAATAI